MNDHDRWEDALAALAELGLSFDELRGLAQHNELNDAERAAWDLLSGQEPEPPRRTLTS